MRQLYVHAGNGSTVNRKILLNKMVAMLLSFISMFISPLYLICICRIQKNFYPETITKLLNFLPLNDY